MRIFACALMLSVVACDSKKAERSQPAGEDAAAPVSIDAAPSVDAAPPTDAAPPPPVDARVKKAENEGPSDEQIREAIANRAFLKTATKKEEPSVTLRREIADVKKSAKTTSQPSSLVKVTIKPVGKATSLDKDSVLRRVRTKYVSGIERCHETLLAKDDKAAGAVAVTITIGLNGRVTKAISAGFDPSIESCIEGIARKWRFGEPKPTSASFELKLRLKVDG